MLDNDLARKVHDNMAIDKRQRIVINRAKSLRKNPYIKQEKKMYENIFLLVTYEYDLKKELLPTKIPLSSLLENNIETILQIIGFYNYIENILGMEIIIRNNNHMSKRIYYPLMCLRNIIENMGNDSSRSNLIGSTVPIDIMTLLTLCQIGISTIQIENKLYLVVDLGY